MKERATDFAIISSFQRKVEFLEFPSERSWQILERSALGDISEAI